jgi:hypothetical protein
MTWTTDIVKILGRVPPAALRCVVRNDIGSTLRTLSEKRGQLEPTVCAQLRWWPKKVGAAIDEVESSKELLIRLSWVRPPLVPPNLQAL